MDFILGYPNSVNWTWTLIAIWIVVGLIFAVGVFFQDKKHNFRNGIGDTLFGATIVSLVWPLGIWVVLGHRPGLFFASVFAVWFYYYHSPENLITGFICFGLFCLGWVIVNANHRSKWEPTGDDVFPYRRKGPF